MFETSKNTKNTKNNQTKFIVATSRIAELKQERKENDPITKARAFLSDKKSVAESLYCTRPCNKVVRESKDQNYGVCNLATCSYAHSLSQYRIPPCAFGSRCYRARDAERPCAFIHPYETREDYYRRTGKDIPDLPETSELTHVYEVAPQ